FHRDPPFGLRRRLAPSPPKPRTGDSAGGAGVPGTIALSRGVDRDALFAAEGHSLFRSIFRSEWAARISKLSKGTKAQVLTFAAGRVTSAIHPIADKQTLLINVAEVHKQTWRALPGQATHRVGAAARDP